MNKIVPLKVCRGQLVFCAMCASNRSRFGEFIQQLGVAVLMIGCAVIPGYRHLADYADELSNGFGGCEMAFASIITLGDSLGLALKKHKVQKFFNELLETVQKRMNHPASALIFSKCEDLASISSRRIFNIVVHGGFTTVAVFNLIGASINYFTGVDVSEWKMDYKSKMYFEQSTISNYVINLTMQHCTLLYIGVIYGVIGAFIVDSARYIDAICQSWKTLFDELMTEIMRHSKTSELQAQIGELVDYHVEFLNLIQRLTDCLEIVMFAQCFAGIGLFTVSVYQIDHNFPKFNDEMLLAINGFWIGISIMFSSCFSPTKVTENGFEIGKYVYESNWYVAPPKLQRYLEMIIRRSQRPKYLHGLNIIRCSMESFTKLINSSMSYFIMMRRLSL